MDKKFICPLGANKHVVNLLDHKYCEEDNQMYCGTCLSDERVSDGKCFTCKKAPVEAGPQFKK
jgi:hypothetical protein